MSSYDGLTRRTKPGPASDDAAKADAQAAAADQGESSPLRSIHTKSFADLCLQQGISVAVTTYQAGFVILLRHDGQSINTHFRTCQRPMGLAARPGRLAVGAVNRVLEYRNMADVAARLPGVQTHDACFLPRDVHYTGDIDVHEMAFGANDELWLVNTRFSCLCTLNRADSFVPRWRPPFVSGLSPQDRCHLNGLAMVEGQPRYATALGATDSEQGWRDNKATGGVLIDIESGETVAAELSMPHSPRWYDGRLWLLESGDGSLGTVDLNTGRYQPVCHVGGFTRGIAFIGPYALVGISQVRESAVFSGIPIVERVKERTCGVSVVDLRSGNEVGFVRFEGSVQEIFAVQILRHRFPELLEETSEQLNSSFALGDDALADVNWVESRQEPDPPDTNSPETQK